MQNGLYEDNMAYMKAE